MSTKTTIMLLTMMTMVMMIMTNLVMNCSIHGRFFRQPDTKSLKVLRLTIWNIGNTISIGIGIALPPNPSLIPSSLPVLVKCLPGKEVNPCQGFPSTPGWDKSQNETTIGKSKMERWHHTIVSMITVMITTVRCSWPGKTQGLQVLAQVQKQRCSTARTKNRGWSST